VVYDVNKSENLKPNFFTKEGRKEVCLAFEYLVNITKNEKIAITKK